MKSGIPTYDALMKKSYGYDVDVQKKPEWQLMKTLYTKNYLENTDTEQKIPKRIHQIWLGNNPMPEKYHFYMSTWRDKHPDWEYRLWTDADVCKIPIVHKDIFNLAQNYGMKSDILRYEILKQYGGIYVDTDFECLHPLDDLLNLEFFTGIGFDKELQLYIGLIGSVAGHPIIRDCANTLCTYYSRHKGSIIHNATGANHFTKCFLQNTNESTKGVVAFPMDFFYPYPNSRRDSLDNPYSYISPATYAIHHWGISWAKKR